MGDICTIAFKQLRDSARVPEYQTLGAAGADIFADLGEGWYRTVWPGTVEKIPTGIAMAIPDYFEAQVRSRSGLAAKHHVVVLNSPGTIDSDYRGEISVLLINHGSEKFTVKHGDRIAQLVVAPVARAKFVDSRYDLPQTDRGEGGFGSTGEH